MPHPTFKSWLGRRDHTIPIADRIMPLIAQAGRDTLDDLLNGLVIAGLLRITVENGLRVYRGGLEITRYISRNAR